MRKAERFIVNYDPRLFTDAAVETGFVHGSQQVALCEFAFDGEGACLGNDLILRHAWDGLHRLGHSLNAFLSTKVGT